MVSVVDDDGVVRGVVQGKLRRAVIGDPGGLLELQLLCPLIVPIEIGPLVCVLPAQESREGQRENPNAMSWVRVKRL